MESDALIVKSGTRLVPLSPLSSGTEMVISQTTLLRESGTAWQPLQQGDLVVKILKSGRP